MTQPRFHDALLPLLVDADEVRPHPDNAKQGDTDAIIRSMRKNGVYRPVMAQRSTGYVLAGNHTYAALLELGATQVPVVWLDVDMDEARRIMLADNRTADLGSMDDALLLSLLESLPDLEGSGYEVEDRDALAALLDLDGPGFDGDDQDAADDQERAAWPWIKAQVEPDTFVLFQSIPGEDTGAKMRVLLAAYESAQ